jgi:AraC-like DNA-binding protein
MLSRSVLLRLCRARDRLCEPCERSPSIHEVAQEAGLSTGRFIRQFTAVFGETPHQRRIRARLDLAKLLLAVGERSVTDVCMDVGFSSLGTFSALFARRVGIAPTLYRRRVRMLVQVPERLPHVLAPGCLSLMAEAFMGLGATPGPLAAAISEKPSGASSARLPRQ